MTAQAIPEAPQVEATEFRLSPQDRCDACGAQAYVAVKLADGELLFCAHHAAEHKAKLAPIATEWHDETARLHA